MSVVIIPAYKPDERLVEIADQLWTYGFRISDICILLRHEENLDTFAYLPVQDFGNAFSTFVAQNYGAGNKERIRKGTRVPLE